MSEALTPAPFMALTKAVNAFFVEKPLSSATAILPAVACTPVWTNSKVLPSASMVVPPEPSMLFFSTISDASRADVSTCVTFELLREEKIVWVEFAAVLLAAELLVRPRASTRVLLEPAMVVKVCVWPWTFVSVCRVVPL